MRPSIRHRGRELLRQALNNSTAEFREGQWEAIQQLVYNKAQILMVQGTGWGKSIVYFLATRLLREQDAGPTLLISPLLALMRNQILAAERIGLHASTINSSNREEWQKVQLQLKTGRVDILIVSPERLANEDFRDKVLLPIAGTIGLFVVDEAHCISVWGHDFRPDYRRIFRILQALPRNIPVLATTATANDPVVEDIVAQIGERLCVTRGPLARKSLCLQNIPMPGQAERMAWLAERVPQLPGSGIIYTLTVRDGQRLAFWLQLQGIDAYTYSGDMETSLREDLEKKLLDNQIKVLVATPALGMGFDKPDIGFVIHFQRPGSVIHYYQQVGRAGRGLDHAYGVLLCGNEDEEINEYFIQKAFPPEDHVRLLLEALEQADDGLSVPMIEQQLNLSRSQIVKVLKFLSVETPSPVTKDGTHWYATAIDYKMDRTKIERLTARRHYEQDRMQTYMKSESCLMAFLQQELDDPHTVQCGRCAVCIGKPLLPETCSNELINKAALFLRRNEQPIEPRRQWPSGDALSMYGWHGKIPPELKVEEGRALSLWGDAGWGNMVKDGKEAGHFDDALVEGAVEMVKERWHPSPTPTWVTCVPSHNHPLLVPDFAQRLANTLGLSFVECICKIRVTEPQKRMKNSYQQARNLAGAFEIDRHIVKSDPVLLVDDMVDSRWTFTVLAALLRTAGSGPVFPLALADAGIGDDS